MSRRKRKMPKSAKRRLMVFGTLSVIIVGYFIISCSYYIYRIHSLKQEVKSLQESYSNLQENEEELKTDIEKLQDEDYLARFARENYHYTKDDELVIQRSEETKEEDKTSKKQMTMDTDMIMLIGSSILGLIVLYVLIRKK